MMRATEYLEHLRITFPELIEQVQIIKHCYDQKLYHQLTSQLEDFVLLPQVAQKNELVNLYEHFIKEFESKLKPLSLVLICITIASHLENNESARKFLEQISEKVKKDKSGYILSLAFIASKHLDAKQLPEAKQILETAKDELKGVTGLEQTVYASFYQVNADYHKIMDQQSEFYQSALLYLSYSKEIPLPQQQTLALDLCIAALVSDNVYSFGDLIVNPVLKSLEGTPFAWLIQLLKVYNVGNIHQYQQLIAKNQDALTKIPKLNNNKDQLAQKISILSLIDLAFRTPSDKRLISFATIAQTTELQLGEIEFLLMKALSLKLIRGLIDQIDQTIMITWVTPRILDINQIATMKSKILDWTDKTQQSLRILETETVDLVV
ncbi:hypothetical protein SAMD00019534_045560, partial [Acytostelium subglobosum LB1]|uniref:hypothetical protein n=1 Tax=Acytostelium subglobosum LB1 TaxID=1410327 RepID=UPI0006447BAA